MPCLVQRSSCTPNILYPCSQANLTMSPYWRPTPIMKVCWGESRAGHQIPIEIIDNCNARDKRGDDCQDSRGTITLLTLALWELSGPGPVLQTDGAGWAVYREPLATGELSLASCQDPVSPGMVRVVLHINSDGAWVVIQGTLHRLAPHTSLAPGSVLLTHNRTGHGQCEPSVTNYLELFLKGLFGLSVDLTILYVGKIATSHRLTFGPG